MLFNKSLNREKEEVIKEMLMTSEDHTDREKCSTKMDLFFKELLNQADHLMVNLDIQPVTPMKAN